MSNPVKVVHISSAHKDGDVRIFHKECVTLANAGYDVTMVIPNAVERVEKGVKIVSVNAPYKSRLKRVWLTVNKVCKAAAELDADVYHLHDPELLRIAHKYKRQGKKVIYDAHEDLPRQIMSKAYIPGFLRKLISWFIEKYENRIGKKLDGIITATPFIRDRFLKINSTTEVINNFPLLAEVEIQNQKNTIRENAICYIGAISEIRGISQLIEACGIAKTKLYLAGEMEPGLAAKFARLDGWKYVEYLGLIDRTQSLELKRKCLAGIVPFLAAPNHINAQPNKLFEYMGSGLPVICSDFPLWKLIIEANDCGICIDSSRPNEIANAIIKISGSKDSIHEMGAKGIQLVSEIYNWGIEKEKLILFYKNLSES